jgi:hypothetical protein
MKQHVSLSIETELSDYPQTKRGTITTKFTFRQAFTALMGCLLVSLLVERRFAVRGWASHFVSRWQRMLGLGGPIQFLLSRCRVVNRPWRPAARKRLRQSGTSPARM